jgi:uncharacterized membrane protein
MDLYLILKFVHVTSAIIWLGGAFVFIVLMQALSSRANAERFYALLANVSFIGPRLFLPASVMTLITGLATAHVGGFGWPAWVVLSLAAVTVTTLVGAFKLGPMGDRYVAAAKAKGPAAAWPLGMQLLRLARADYVLQFFIVFLMVTKPDWSDLALIVPLVLTVLLVGVAAFLPPTRRTTNLRS